MASFRASESLPPLRTGTISNQEALKASERARKRLERARQQTETRERLRRDGDEYFKEGRYSEAAAKYEQAARIGGKKKPVLLSNLAEAYLKLNLFEQAEEAATEALIYDPTNVKARYRRGLARKGLRRANGASIDFEAVVELDPQSSETASELQIVKKMAANGRNTASDDEYSDSEYIWPRPITNTINRDAEDSDSGSSDCEHVGNGVSCRFYNHGSCSREKDCHFSHAPDDKSVRDKLGRNVCILAILGSCEHGPEKCIYSHDFKNLPDKGWWNESGHRRELQQHVFVARTITSRKSEKYILEMIHGYLYDEGFGVPRNLEAVLDRGTWGHAIYMTKSSIPAPTASLPTTDERFIMIIALVYEDAFNGVYGAWLTALNSKIKTHTATTPHAAEELLSSPNLSGVLIADPEAIQTKHDSKISAKVVEYARNGGLVVFGGDVSYNAASYTREDLKLNKSQETVKANPSLASSFSAKALYLAGMSKENFMYSTRRNASESPIIHAKYGNGYVGYIGDVNAEEESTSIILSMFGLLDHTYPSSSNINATTTSATSAPTKRPATFSQKFVMLLSLENQDWFHELYHLVYSALRENVRIKQALSSQMAFSLLSSPDLVGVFITDYGIAEQRHSHLLRKLVEYARAGGLVVAGGQFSKHMTAVRSFFQPWGFQWQKGSYQKTVVEKNPVLELGQLNQSLPQTYNVKASHLTGVSREHAVYAPTASGRNAEESSVVHVKVGKGWFGYIGDSDAAKESTPILLAMLGLLDHQYENIHPNPLIAKEKNFTKRHSMVSARTNGKPSVLVISMAEIPDIYKEEHEHLLKSLHDQTGSVRATGHASAIEGLSSPDLVGVLVNEPTIIVNTKYQDLLNKLTSFVKGGGTVVFGGSFSSLAGPRLLDEFWKQSWGLDWTFGGYRQSLLSAQTENAFIADYPSLVKSYDTKAVHLSYKGTQDAVYRDQKKENQGAILRAKVGLGYVGYVGDVYGEAESTEIILAMLGQPKRS